MSCRDRQDTPTTQQWSIKIRIKWHVSTFSEAIKTPHQAVHWNQTTFQQEFLKPSDPTTLTTVHSLKRQTQ